MADFGGSGTYCEIPISSVNDYSQEILPPSPFYLPLFAKDFTRLRQHIYQYIKALQINILIILLSIADGLSHLREV
jgi:hypothetical protein